MVVLRFLRACFFLSIGSDANKGSGCQSYRTHAEEASPRGVLHHRSFFCMIAHFFNLSFFRVDRSADDRNNRALRAVLLFLTTSSASNAIQLPTPAYLNHPPTRTCLMAASEYRQSLDHRDPLHHRLSWIQSAPRSKLRSILAITPSYYLNRILAIIPLSS